MKITSFLLPLLSITISPLYGQIDFHFNLKEAIELPGNANFDFAIRNIDGDSVPDYIYRDSSIVYLIDGSNHQISFELEAPAGTSLLGSGDLNGDGLDDIMLCGTYPDTPETNFVLVFIAPDFINTYTLIPSRILPGAENISAIWSGQFSGGNVLFIGTSVVQSESRSYLRTGGILAYEFNSGQFTRCLAAETGGAVQQIETWDYDDTTRMVLRTYGSFYAEDWQGYTIADKTWSDLIVIDTSYSMTNLWHVPQSNDNFAQGNIFELFVGKPEPTDNDYLFFHSHSDRPVKDSNVCINNPSGNVIWFKAGYYCTYCTYKISLVSSLTNQFKDLWIFRTDWLYHAHSRNPYDGYLEEIGVMTGARGLYRSIFDLENDGIDEFLYTGTVSLYIFNLANQTFLDDDYLVVPKEIQLSFYPNPFNSSTNCHFSISSATELKLEIFDILGRQVVTLADGTYGPGYYNISWDASSLSSGIYLAMMRTPNVKNTARLTLIK